jgi:polysaccharide biosynthesis protein PelA
VTGSRARLAVAAASVVLGALLWASPAAVAVADPSPRTVPRTVLALWDSAHVQGARWTNIHEFVEMPLNHLGLVVRYHDIRQGFPSMDRLADVRGVLTWFTADAMPDPQAYLRWLDAVARSGRRLVVIGPLGVSHDEAGEATPLAVINRVLGYLGWRYEGGWLATTYGARYRILDDRIVGFERKLPAVAPPYAHVTATSGDARVALHISVDGRQSTDSDLVILTPRGTYVAPGYAAFAARIDDQYSRQWYLNPFELFRRAFNTDDLPKADTATVSGRRIYYSHVDGDGWRNMTQIEPYRTRYTIAARVVLDEILRKFPDFPVSVGAIVGDLDPAWYGTRESLAVAREIYAEPQVEASIHTYSHPLEWRRFDPAAALAAGHAGEEERAGGTDMADPDKADTGRSYTIRPFSLTLEFDDAAAFVNALLPPGKRVDLIQWPGDTRPFEQAIAHARALGLANINGGDTRFDREFPSTAWVAPLGVRVGHELQVFASNSNENTYTDLWRDRFYGFSYLAATVRNTGTPRRLKPFNLYYHMYSGERLSSLNAVLANLAYARTLSLAPIETSRFSRIVEGFFSTVFDCLAPRIWRIRNRGALQTIRFDRAAFEGVDFARSHGVVGQRHELGSLFVALDETVEEPIIALKGLSSASREPREDAAYLVDSRWRVFEVQRKTEALRFATTGYGPGASTWEWPVGDRVAIHWRSASGRSGEMEAPVGTSGSLAIHLPQLTGERVDVTVTTVRSTHDGR